MKYKNRQNESASKTKQTKKIQNQSAQNWPNFDQRTGLQKKIIKNENKHKTLGNYTYNFIHFQ